MASHSAIYSFALSLPVYHLFDYEVDQDMPTTPGSRFLLPFGNRDRVGPRRERSSDPKSVGRAAAGCTAHRPPPTDDAVRSGSRVQY